MSVTNYNVESNEGWLLIGIILFLIGVIWGCITAGNIWWHHG